MPLNSILIVDDSHVDRMLLKRQLSKHDIADKILEATNGQEALDLLTDQMNKNSLTPGEFPPPLIFLDINMPIMNGFEFLDKFKELREQREEYRSVVFVMFSSSESKEDLERVAPFEFVKDFVVKGTKNSSEWKSFIDEKFK